MAKKFIFFKKEFLEIKDIKETIKALEKISAVDVHNLKIASQKLLNYEKALKEIFYNITEEPISHILFKTPPASEKLKIILLTEEGLCGSFSNRLLDFFEFSFKKNDKILVMGEKGKKLFQERKIKINYFFPGSKDIPKEENVRKIKDFIISQFLSGKFKEVLIFYLKFESLAVQKPKVFSFLPFGREKFKEDLEKESERGAAYPIYEPSQKEIINYLLEEYLGLVFYQKVLETKLSELSARTMAMEEAGEKARKLIERLSHRYFKAKREAITKNINDLYAHRAIK